MTVKSWLYLLLALLILPLVAKIISEYVEAMGCVRVYWHFGISPFGWRGFIALTNEPNADNRKGSPSTLKGLVWNIQR